MTIDQFNKENYILFIIHYINEQYHFVKIDRLKWLNPEQINQEVQESTTYYKGLHSSKFTELEEKKNRETAINEMIISVLNEKSFFSESIDHNNINNIQKFFIESTNQISFK